MVSNVMMGIGLGIAAITVLVFTDQEFLNDFKILFCKTKSRYQKNLFQKNKCWDNNTEKEKNESDFQKEKKEKEDTKFDELSEILENLPVDEDDSKNKKKCFDNEKEEKENLIIEIDFESKKEQIEKKIHEQPTTEKISSAQENIFPLSPSFSTSGSFIDFEENSNPNFKHSKTIGESENTLGIPDSCSNSIASIDMFVLAEMNSPKSSEVHGDGLNLNSSFISEASSLSDDEFEKI
ncbi:hypothetical protein HK099_003534 [Clydaea vesicula]|uniref:Uncharacterized protein n=1 Tax=Clydaea vesicula TaxID=447962 RepID=A0AAD5Y0W2_9FUNG|nr:hypothetical protein HK099_003534 [Clydaea vesicula]KAJ3385737.1 hypothetical protein HDU92_002917 [Lobulomyces angularis]